jgi:EAL and modified HD-GYP domain-containing signal transduction protein
MADDREQHEGHEGGVVVARQPIFDAGWEVVAYELLYRPLDDASGPVAPEAMTAGVLANAFSELGLDLLVGDRPAHINVTRDFLLDMRPLPLEPKRTVIELVEDQVVDKALVKVVEEVVEAGFTLALDDYTHAPNLKPLLDLASIVKLDVQALSARQLEAEVRKLEPRKLTLVAEKVETAEEYELCRELEAFDAYQGYFFALPELSRTSATPTRELGTLTALASTDVDTTLETLESIVRRDAGLSHKLLRYANSAHVSPLRPIESLRHAVTMIGSVAIRRWGLLLALSGLRDAPSHLLNMAMLRARMSELLAPAMKATPDRAFTAGLFSLLDALTGRPMSELVGELSLDSRLSNALVEHAGPEGAVLSATLAYERGAFEDAAAHAPAELLADAYTQALRWSDQFAPAAAAA